MARQMPEKPSAARELERRGLAIDVVIVSFDMCLRDKEHFLTSATWRLMVVDEAQRLKNHASKLNGVLRSVPVDHRLLLTGTPLQNDLQELWTLLHFVDPGNFLQERQDAWLQRHDLLQITWMWKD